MSTVSYAVEHRPAAMRRADAWHDCEIRPCGEPCQVAWHYWTALGIRAGCNSMAQAPSLAGCVAVRPRPLKSRIIVWEPLLTKAPGPHLTQPLCCYLQTIIFYTRPYTINRFKRWWRDSSRQEWRESQTGSFVEWDQIETRLGWNDRVSFAGEIFEHATGRVLWTSLPGERRRWWMRHGFRRVET